LSENVSLKKQLGNIQL